MKEALKEAKKAFKRDEVPIGAVLVDDKGEIIVRGYNKKETKNDPSAHAEMIAIREGAKKLKTWRLDKCTLYVTLEPCPMCLGVMLQARIKRVVFGAYDPKAGALGSVINLNLPKLFNHYIEVRGGVLEEECSELIKSFFRKLRGFSKL
ncbi:MAG: tRNA adenosine(34) deaminase TadA [Dictyoglomaceae bacterium]